VPRSPITSTGRSSGAARLARSTASRKEEDWPTNWVLRSTTKHWDDFPCFGKNKQFPLEVETQETAVFRHFPRLARSLFRREHAPQGETDFREEEMIDMSKLGQTLVSTVAAALLTVTAVGAAVGPARAVEIAPVSLVAAPVSGQAQA
jgi:hypothetical protein